MRTLRLAKVAALAEGLRLRQQVRRQVMRAVLGVIAVVFLLTALAGLHAAAVAALASRMHLAYAALIVGGVDLIIATIFGILAARNQPSQIEREALAVRDQARAEAMRMAAVGMLAKPALRMLGARKVYGLTLAALTAQFLSGRK